MVPPLDEVLAFKTHFFLHAKDANFKPFNMNTFTDTKRANVWYITRVLSRFDTNLAPIRWTISLLLISGKIFDRLIFNKMFEFFIVNNLTSPSQSSFKPGSSCVNQLLPITHNIFKPFDDGLETRIVFLDISKVFDKVWHEWLLYKLEQNGISGDVLRFLADFFYHSKQRAALENYLNFELFPNQESFCPAFSF